jgi:hypothetical protein
MKKNILLLAFVAASLAFGSCSKSNDDPTPCSTNYGAELQTELNAVINAGNIYANDPTPANCTSYKASYQAYLNELKPYGNCSALTGQNRTDFNNAVAEAEASIADLCD